MKFQFKTNRVATLFALLTVFKADINAQEDWKLLFGLRGDWKFEIGDDMRWAEAKFDDSKWESIYAPAKWEDEGFPGYDGYAWYRKHFQAANDWKDKSLFLRMGRIDDVDEVYVNGKLVGENGIFPPDFETAYNVDRVYLIPTSYLKIPGDNVIAVRVYDDERGGGIYEGRLGIYEDKNALTPDVPLAGEWKFMTGDDTAWKEMACNDSKWSKISVPAHWENQGHSDYDGMAWYRLNFRVPSELVNEKLILLVGQIDDYDETYLNGELVGKTGRMRGQREDALGNAYQEVRAYTIPSGRLLANQDNVLAVRVYDGFRMGGIYKGPIGIVTREHYLKWERKAKRDFEDSWKDFWKDLNLNIK